MDLPRLAKKDTASVIESEVIDPHEANWRTSNKSRIVDGNIWGYTKSLHIHTHTHNKVRDVDGNSQDTTFGDLLMEKKYDIMRIGFQNFNGLTGKLDDPVDRSLRDWITDNSFDVFGISEVNMYWPRVRKELQFNERINKMWQPGQCRSRHAFNRTEKRLKRSIRQYGGTAQLSFGTALAHEFDRGEDFRGLGRWVWQKYRGKNNRQLRIVTAYRPNLSGGPYTVYSQHRFYYNEINKTKWEPRGQMLKDLANEISRWKQNREQVILMMDCNEDVRSPTFKKFLIQVGMQEVLLKRHGNHAPATYIDGQLPIDGIFATASVKIVQGGYTSFADGVQGQRTDHRCLWADIALDEVFGHKTPPLIRFAGRRVKSSHPRIVHKFNTSYKQFVLQHKLSLKIF